jgi:ATP-dependent protease HslVU (ClpYQ) peptidase subunit
MTLIAALQGQDGLVLASDSRGTIGDPRGLTAISDVHKKIFPMCKYCGIAVAGTSELANNLLNGLFEIIKKESVEDIKDILNKTYDYSKKEYSKWFGNRLWVASSQIIDQRPSLIFILAGYSGISENKFYPFIYLMNSALDFAPQLCTTGNMLAGVPQYATYLINRLHNPQMKIEHLQALATYLISETATQDPKVGGPINMAIITPKNGYVELGKEIIEQIIKKNEEQNLKLRKFFFGG